MEGFKDLIWSGDKIVWRNLLKHYLLCLDHACILLTLNGSDTPINLASLPVLKTENDLPTQDYKDAFKSACDTFLNTPSVPECAEGLASRQRPIRRDELRCHLRMLHWHALNAIFTAYRERRIQLDASGGEMFRDLCAKMPVRPEVFGMTNEFEQRHTGVEGGSDQLYAAMNAIHQQGILIGKYNNPTSPAVRNSSLIVAEFPDHYVKLVEKMIHPDWYMACFTESYASPSMWGHYANAHKGVCLKFGIGVTSGKPTLTLNGIVGRRDSKTDPAGQPAFSHTNHPLYKVAYKATYPETDFFRSLGQLRGTALRWWYSDALGKNSSCARDVFENEAAWGEKYRGEFLEGQTTKLQDWAYEEEYRLVLSDSLTDYAEDKGLALKYEFSDLKGIIFGINTPEEDKLAIIRVIQTKCAKENRSEFEFFQAYYAKRTGKKIDAAQLSLIRF